MMSLLSFLLSLSLSCVPSLPPPHPSFVLGVNPPFSPPPPPPSYSPLHSRQAEQGLWTWQREASFRASLQQRTHNLKHSCLPVSTLQRVWEVPGVCVWLGGRVCVFFFMCWWVCGCLASLFMGHWEMCVSQRRWTGYRGACSPALPLILLLLLPLSFLSSTPPFAQGAIHIPENCEYSSTAKHPSLWIESREAGSVSPHSVLPFHLPL